MGLEGKVGLITGSSRGIGKSIALRLAKAGVNVVITGRDIGKINETVKEIEGVRRETIGVKTDVSDIDEVKNTIDTILERFGRLDILVNNAGITRDRLLLRMNKDDWETVLNINLTGVYNCTKLAIRQMVKQRMGKIVNITSMVGAMGNIGQANYAASKGGIIAFTKSVAREYAGRGINVNAVAPGYIETDMTSVLDDNAKKELLKQIPFKRFGSPWDVANCVSFLVSDESSYITGQVLHVNGGLLMS
ncbi:MAG: 3-oxoacyl-[acyl-carrier-protein] reductase [Nitrospirota bacterium]